jgi:hypothetical protein
MKVRSREFNLKFSALLVPFDAQILPWTFSSPTSCKLSIVSFMYGELLHV